MRTPTYWQQTLLALVAVCEAGLTAVRENGLPAVAKLAADYVHFKSEVEAHFSEEEQVVLPMMRANFSADDFKPVGDKVLAPLTPDDVAWFVGPFPDDAARSDWLARVLGFSSAVIARDMMPASKKYQSDVMAPMRALIDGAKEAPPKPAAGCACVVM